VPEAAPERPFTYIDISAVDAERKEIVAARTMLGSEAPSRARQQVLPADVLVSTTRPNLNAVAKVPPELTGAIASTGFAVLRPRAGLDADYLLHWTRSPGFVAAVAAMVKGALYPAVTDRQVLDLMIPLPPLGEQRRIAARLRDQLAEVDHLRVVAGDARSSLGALEREAHAIFEKEEWSDKARPLGDVAAVVRGVTFRAGDTRRTTSRGTLPILRAGNIGTVLNLTSDLLWVDTRLVAAWQLLRVGDIAVCMSSGSASVVGKSAPLIEPFAGSVGAFCAIVRHGPQVDPAFLAGFMRSPAFWSWRGRSAQGVGIQNLKVTGLSELPVPLPPLDEQRHIAARLHEQLAEIDRAKAALESQRTAIRALPAALLREIFGPA